jgi:hypothetical protein
MSNTKHDSPKTTETPSDDRPTTLEQRVEQRLGTRRNFPWFAVSLTLHLVAAVLLVYLTPLREVVRDTFQPAKPENTMSSETLNEVSQSLEDSAEVATRRNILEQQRVRREMDQILSQVSAKFEAFESIQEQRAAQDALEEMTAAATQLEQAVEALESEAPATEIDRHLAKAQHAQDRASEKLKLVPFDVQPAREVQDQAGQEHLEATADYNRANEREAQADRISPDVEIQKSQVQELQRQIAEEEAKEKPSQGKLTRTRKNLKKRVKTIEMHREKMAQAAQARKEAVEAERRALETQNKAIETLSKEIEKNKQALAAAQAQSGDSSGQSGTSDQAASKAQAEEQAGQADMPDLYEMGKETEDSLARKLKEIRAMDLAMVRDMPLEDARKNIDLVRPERPEVDAQLLRRQTPNEQRFEAKKEEIRKVQRETGSMVKVAYQMLETAKQSAENLKFGQEDAQLAQEMEQEEEFALLIRDLAMEDISGDFADLSQAMQMMQQSAAAPRPQVDFKDLTTEEKLEEIKKLMLNSQGQTPGGALPELVEEMVRVPARRITVDSGRGARFIYLDRWWSIGPWANPGRRNIDRQYPPDTLVDLDATYKLSDGRTLKWKYVESDHPRMTPSDPTDYGIYYAYTEVYFEEATDMLLATGSDDRGILYINGIPVWISATRQKGWDIDEAWRKVHFKKGINRILFRVENGHYYVGFSLVMMLPDQK